MDLPNTDGVSIKTEPVTQEGDGGELDIDIDLPDIKKECLEYSERMAESVCKEKWKNHRTVFVRHMKPPPSGSGARIKKPYYLADAMQFVIPFIKAQTSTVSGNLPNISQQEVIDNEDNEEDSQESISQITTPPSTNCQPHSLPPPPPQPLSLPSTSLSSSSLPLPKKSYRKSNDMSEVDNNFNEYLKSKKAKIDNTDQVQVQVARKMFLLSLLPDVYSMSDTQMRAFKRRVLCLVDGILKETPSTSAQHFLLSASGVNYAPVQQEADSTKPTNGDR